MSGSHLGTKSHGGRLGLGLGLGLGVPRSHLGTKSHGVPLLVNEIVHLLRDFLAGLALVEFLVLKHWRVVLLERIRLCHRLKVPKQEIPRTHFFWVEVASA